MEKCPQSMPSFGSTLTFPASPYARAVVMVEMVGFCVLPQSDPFPGTCVLKVCLGHRKYPLPDGLEGLNWIKTHHRFQILGSNSRISTEIPSTPSRYQSNWIYPDFWNVPHSHTSSVSTCSGLQITQLQLCPERSCSLMSPASLRPRAPGDRVWFLYTQPSTEGGGRQRKEG